jgi:predicted nuclease of predicted toxin-antitoxin system
LKFKTDENLPLDVATMLNVAGYNAESVYSEKLQGCADSFLIGKCQEEGRILITLDNDFSNIIAYPPDKNMGLIVLRPKSQGKEAVLKIVSDLLPKLSDHFAPGQLWIVNERRIRIREREANYPPI